MHTHMLALLPDQAKHFEGPRRLPRQEIQHGSNDGNDNDAEVKDVVGAGEEWHAPGEMGVTEKCTKKEVTNRVPIRIIVSQYHIQVV